jgi:DNA-binding beta-propeller fold protein YncE
MQLRSLIGYAACLTMVVTVAVQIPVSGQTPASAPAQGGGRAGGRGGSGEYLRGPAEKELIYVTLPGTLEGSPDSNGSGIVVLDAKNNYNFVKRIPTWFYPASKNPEQIAGVTASPVTQMIYVAARGRLGAIDLNTEKMVWENAYDGNCCERPQVSPDGSFMYVGSDLKDFWYVVNPKTGELITKVVNPAYSGDVNGRFRRDVNKVGASDAGTCNDA